MSSDTATQDASEGASAIERYYRLHSRIYDATRWSFLFGREAIVDRLAQHSNPSRILEVGCGTGMNLSRLALRFPKAQITGVDLSDVMLDVARKKMAPFGDRVALERRCYDSPLNEGGFDVVLFSYAVSMFNPGWIDAIEAAKADLCEGGQIAVVDFHNSPVPAFKRWMGVNHVRMDGHLLPSLQSGFKTTVSEIHNAYGGLWKYALHIGSKGS